MVLWSLIGLGCVFAYLQVGYWLGVLHWWSWHVNSRRNRVLSWTLFPITNVIERAGGANGDPCNVGTYGAGGRRAYLGIKAATWPVSLTVSLVGVTIVVTALTARTVFRHSARTVTFILRCLFTAVAAVWFCLTEGPSALYERILTWRARKHDERFVRTVMYAEPAERATLVSAQYEDPGLVERYRVLLAKRTSIDEELARLEAEDAAQRPGAAFRGQPLPVRAARTQAVNDATTDDVEEAVEAPRQIRG